MIAPRMSSTIRWAALLALAASLGQGAFADATPRRDAEGNELTAGGGYAHVNALVLEPSPYLQLHAHEPVDWMPWSEAAFAKARAEDKPIFLSVGYSTCHWCHVMARESFSDDDVALVLNASFVPIKVDREERPDIDDTYVRAVQAMTGSAGWPLSVWLTPERQPFAGGTYFPKDDFLARLDAVSSAWTRDRASLRRQGADVAASVAGDLAVTRTTAELSGAVIDRAVPSLMQGFDAANGGWGLPRFPNESPLLLLLARAQEGEPAALALARRALDGMEGGGIHDQVGGGFARYSTDATWLVPHFEKMLYNQAWLGMAYVEAWRLTLDPSYRRTADGVVTYLLRDMRSPSGGFYAAEDADSEAEEGKFYVWTVQELREALGAKDAALAMEWFGVTPQGNFRERPGASILTARLSPEAFGRARGLTPSQVVEHAGAWRSALLLARSRRVRPGRDEKVLADWNGMAIAMLARAGSVLGRADALDAARHAADMVLGSMRGKDGGLLHRWKDGHADIPGFLDDHAAVADGLVELFDATGEKRWLDEAESLYAAARTQMRDPADGAFFRTGPLHEALLARGKDGYDGALPSGNSLMAWDAVRLWRRTGKPAYRDDAAAIFRAFAGELGHPQGSAFMLRAFDAWRHGESGPRARSDDGVVTASVLPVAASGTRGSDVRLDVTVTLAPGWHVGAGGGAPSADIRPLALSVQAPLALAPVAWPQGKRLKLTFAQESVALYEGAVVVPIRLHVPRDVPEGPLVAWIDVAYQACGEHGCSAPATLRVEAPLVIAVRAVAAP